MTSPIIIMKLFNLKVNVGKLSLLAKPFTPAPQETEQEDYKFKGSLGYRVSSRVNVGNSKRP